MQVRNEEKKKAKIHDMDQKKVTNVRVRNKLTNLQNLKTVSIFTMKAYGGVGV